jgi:hypothetical protein
VGEFHARGHSGTVQVGYMMAAALGDWTLTKGEEGAWHVEAAVKAHDPYWIAQGPKDLLLLAGTHNWHWRVEAMTMDELGTRLVATVQGRPDRR